MNFSNRIFKVAVKSIMLIGLIALILISGTGSYLSHGFYTYTTSTESGIHVGTISSKEKLEIPLQRFASVFGRENEPYLKASKFTSEWIAADHDFHLLGLTYKKFEPEGTHVDLYVRTKSRDGIASDWVEIHEDNDLNSMLVGEDHFAMVRTRLSDALQYKVELTSRTGKVTPSFENVNFTYIDAREVRSIQSESESGFSLAKSELVTPIISRVQWGANEDLRVFAGEGTPVVQEVSEEFKEKYASELAIKKTVKNMKDGRALKWPLEYGKQPIKAVFVHHTASEDGALDDSFATVRAIYYFHAVSRGWGDIGYNYLIDDKGNVFEGRFGGPGVVGAHTANFNVGSIGVALIGDFEDSDVRFHAIDTLTGFLTELVRKYHLDPMGIVSMRGQNLNVISGHRDAGKTACPGSELYKKLSNIRNLVSSLLDEDGLNHGEFIAQEFPSLIELKPFEMKSFEIKLKNTGATAWNRKTYLIYRNGENNIANLDEKAGYLREEKVLPSQVGTFVIAMKSTMISGLKNYYLFLEKDGEVVGDSLLLPVYVDQGEVRYEFVQFTVEPEKTVKKGKETIVKMIVKNTGTLPWTVDAFGCSGISGDFVVKCGLSADTLPSQSVEVTLLLKTGQTIGNLSDTIRFFIKSGDLYIRSKNSSNFSFLVQGDFVTSKPTLKKNFSDVDLIDQSTEVFKPGEKKRVYVTLRNGTKGAWKNVGEDRVSVKFLNSADIKANRAQFEKSIVNRGVVSKLYFDLTAPKKDGSYFVNLVLNKSGKRLNKEVIRFEFSVGQGGADVKVRESGNGSDNNSSDVDPHKVVKASVGPKIRVKLGFTGEPILRADSGISLYDESGKHLYGGKMIDKLTDVKVRFAGGRYHVHVGDRDIVTKFPIRMKSEDGVMQISNYENRPEWNTGLNDNQFRDVLEVRFDEGALIVINELPLEHYLWGLGEVSGAEPVEKIKAMSVIGRSYAYFYIGDIRKFPGKKYDLDDDPDVSQKYRGYGLEKRNAKVVELTKSTSGEMVTYFGNVVKTPYFSSTDGTRTLSAKEVWGWDDTPYLVSVPDPLCKADKFSGHGVGLSGCGAAGAALAGYSYDEILKYYYKEVKVKKVY